MSVLGGLGRSLGALGVFWGHLGVLLRSVGSVSGGCWQHQSAILSNRGVARQQLRIRIESAILVLIWGACCGSFGALGSLFGGLGWLLAALGAVLGRCWELLDPLGGSWWLRGWIQRRSWRFLVAAGKGRVGAGKRSYPLAVSSKDSKDP